MIDRDLAPRLRAAAKAFPAVTLTGPRQSGKSTLCRALFPSLPYANLESPDVREFALSDPRGFLAQYPKGAVLDEVQRTPELASYLQPLIDRDPKPGRWILTGSQNFALLESVSQSLAGRTAVLHLLPLSHREVMRFSKSPSTLEGVLFAGGYPRIHDQALAPPDWLGSYVATYVERDVRSVSNVGDLVTFQRFVELCAGRTGQLVNYSALAADCGISQPTAKSWLSVLETSFILFRLPAWSGNLRKRIVKMPKLHFYDTGLACWLLGIRSKEQLVSHPLRGAIFESWLVSEITKYRAALGERGGLHFYRDQHGLEADAIAETKAGLVLLEAKSGQTVAGDAISAIHRVAEVLKQSNKRVLPMLVHGGDASMTRSGVGILPWLKLGEQDWA